MNFADVLVGSLADRPVWAAMIKQFPAEVRAQAVLELDRLGLAQVALKRAELRKAGFPIAKNVPGNADFVR